MNDVPLVKDNNINSINTSLIAVKKQLKQLTEAVGLIDVPDVDTSVFVKKSEVVDVVESGNMNPVTSNAVVPVDEVALNNMHSVSSNAVAESLSYSTQEQKTGGIWVDGKPIYRKVIECGQLPNNNSKTIPCNISNLEQVVSLQGYAQNGNLVIPLTYTSNYNLQYTIELYYNEGNIVIVTGMDRTSYTKSFAILEYTKTTD